MKGKLFIILIIPVSIFLFYIGLASGSYDVNHDDIAEAIMHFDSSNTFHFIVINLRMPRVLLAFLVGAALSVSGYLMQSMVNNPLADPYILGTASGASLGASLVYLIIPSTITSVAIPSFGAFAGAMLITLLAVFISIDKGHLAPSKLLLTGLGLSSLSVAIISFLIFFSNDDSKLKTIIFWSMGSFESARWNYIPLLGITLIIVILLFSFLTKNINLLLLGESRSYNLGLNVSKLRWIILIGSAFTTGCAVATSGPIGFVGLMVPHFVRGMFGVAGKTNILVTALLGGTFLLACDIASRKIYPPTGIPIGIITSFMGIPFFVYLLSKNSYRFN